MDDLCPLKTNGSTLASAALAAVEIHRPSAKHVALMANSAEDRESFSKLVGRESHPKGCWEWQRTRCRTKGNRYGVIAVQGVNVFAHRFAYLIANGVMPEELFVCHTCDNPPCCNPAHLFLGTKRDNLMDCINKLQFPQQPFGRDFCKVGHRFTPENTIYNRGERECRVCKNARDKVSYHRRKEAKLSARNEGEKQ